MVKEVKKANKMPGYSNMQFMAMQLFGPQNTLKFVHSTVFKNAKKEMSQIIEDIHPDVFFGTHYAPLHIAVELRNNKLACSLRSFFISGSGPKVFSYKFSMLSLYLFKLSLNT